LAVRIYELPLMMFATLLKVALELVPSAVMATRQTRIIRDNMTAYRRAGRHADTGRRHRRDRPRASEPFSQILARLVHRMG
jgi:hypothetical protein